MSLVRFRFWALTLAVVQVWFNGRTSAFQAEYVGSIPITCFSLTLNDSFDRMSWNQLNARVAQWWSIALPRRGSRVRIPSRALVEMP